MKEEKKKTSTKKEIISVGTATRKLINGFISYGFLLAFIILIVFLIVMNCINNFTNSDIPEVLNYTLPTIAAIIIFFIIRSVCYLSTYDLFQKCKVEKKDISLVSSNINLFYILFILLTFAIVIVNLTVNFRNQRKDIEFTREQYYEEYSEDIADDLIIDMYEEFSANKFITTMKSIIIESGIFLGVFSLMTTQRKLIEKFN